MTTQHAKSNAREGDGVAAVADEMKLLAMAFPRADLQHGGAAIATLCTEIDKWADRLTDAMQAQQGAELTMRECMRCGLNHPAEDRVWDEAVSHCLGDTTYGADIAAILGCIESSIRLRVKLRLRPPAAPPAPAARVAPVAPIRAHSADGDASVRRDHVDSDHATLYLAGDIGVARFHDINDAEAFASAYNAAVVWRPIETAPEGELVMVFTPDSGDGDRIDFDCREDGLWLNHDDAYQHYIAVGGAGAGGPDCVCVGPAQEAPYTHWQPYPAAPATGAPR